MVPKARPIRAGANRNPAQIIKDNTQSKRTKEQISADKAAADEVKRLKEAKEAEKKRQKLETIAWAEDSLAAEEHNYNAKMQASIAAAQQKAPKALSKKTQDDLR